MIACGSRGTAAGIVTGYVPDSRGLSVRVPVRARFSMLSTSFRPILEPTSLLSNQYGTSFSGGKEAENRS
jgi:hypothetical protein